MSDTRKRAVGGGRVTRSLTPARLAGRAAVRWAGTYAQTSRGRAV